MEHIHSLDVRTDGIVIQLRIVNVKEGSSNVDIELCGCPKKEGVGRDKRKR
jgi:hypothetical protein